MTTSTPQTPDAPAARLTSRKFLLALAVLLVASLFLALKLIEPLLWRDVVITLMGGYFTSNVAQKVMASKAGTP
ncbi:hypothetical protein LHU53_15800 [Rhodoferax sp. U2-2l]|uniref:hypothetical protein n=1 Tax=Rhodoferax sp. U2-2l TaxID=2884000 RepID=UPI001D0B9A48|nr:hypothetical protein [Rhodoferax sp. U2-2l]MCB8748365.1 hypothetical protein [Rhodoferax sp. U2-2l]